MIFCQECGTELQFEDYGPHGKAFYVESCPKCAKKASEVLCKKCDRIDKHMVIEMRKKIVASTKEIIEHVDKLEEN